MAGITHLLCMALFIALVSRVTLQQCTIENIKIVQIPTGVRIKSQPEWKVTISNDCICTQSQVKLSCSGFETAEPVDPAILSKSGGQCLVINGGEIFGFETEVTFKYASEKFPFKPSDSQIACS